MIGELNPELKSLLETGLFLFRGEHLQHAQQLPAKLR
jgi:hypothetical protein